MKVRVDKLVIDGNNAGGKNISGGFGIALDDRALRVLMDYKVNYPDSYHDITELLFKPCYGAGIERVKAETGETSSFFSDVRNVNSEIDTEPSGEITVLKKCSVTEMTSHIINSVCRQGAESEYFSLEQFVKSDQPWSGYYEAAAGIWGAAHLTHFIGKDWKCINSLPEENRNGDCGAFMSDNGDYTLIFVNSSDSEKIYDVEIVNMEKADAVLYCVESIERSGSGKNRPDWFRVIDKIIPARGTNSYFYRVDVKPYSVLTCTTMTVDEVEGTDTVKSSPYEPKHLELPYSDAFDYSEEQLSERNFLPLYTAEQYGKFEIRKFEDKNVLEQVLTENYDLNESWLSIGDSRWSSCSASVEVMLDSDSDSCFAGIGLRSGYDRENNALTGYQFRIYPNGKWKLICSGEIVLEGTEESVCQEKWNGIKISAGHDLIRCYLNKQQLCEYRLTGAVTPAGRLSVYSSRHRNKFRKLSVTPLAGATCFCNYECGSPDRVKYSGAWTNEKDLFYTDRKNSCFETVFYGGTAALMGKTENARLKIEIDGKIMTAGFYAEKSAPNQAFYYETGFSEEQHKVKVTVLSGKLWFCGTVSDECGNENKNKKTPNVLPEKESEKSKSKLKKSTVFMGIGLAVAGAGVFLFNKIFGKDKK